MLSTALGELAVGESYAAVSVCMSERSDRDIAHLSEAHGLPAVFTGQPPRTFESTGESQNTWRLAANLGEQYAPLITTPLITTSAFESLHTSERRQRAIDDEALACASGAGLVAPITWTSDYWHLGDSRARWPTGRTGA